MKIAMMVRGYIPVPAPKDMIYAPIELAVSIAEGLRARGHHVDFYAPNSSHIHGVPIKTGNLPPLVHDKKEMGQLATDVERLMNYVPGIWDYRLASEMFERARAGEYDLLHFHHPGTALPYTTLYPEVPVALTLHDPIYEWYRDMFSIFDAPSQHFISISNNQRRDAPDLKYARTVYNGINCDKYEFSESHEDYLLFAGRIVPEKGIKEAIRVAQDTNHRLLIIGPTYGDKNEYFEHQIKPHLDDKILYLGFMEQSQLVTYYKKAKAFLMPVQWEEPFGMTMIESMACGTPVIGLRRGAVPEVVVDGVTGFVVDSMYDMADAVGKVGQIDRGACRRHVEENFCVSTMVSNYEAAFKEIIQAHKKASARRQQEKVTKTIKQIPGKISSKIRKLT